MARSGTPHTASTVDYHVWRARSVTVRGRRYDVATKPGLINHGRDDAAASLLAKHCLVSAGQVVVQFQSGSALMSAVAAQEHGAAAVYCTDRSAVGATAAARTMQANGATQATALSGHGSRPLPDGVIADVVGFRIPTEKLAVVQLLADAFGVLRTGGRCYIAGATNEGIKSAATLMQTLFGNATVLGHDSGHRIVMAIKRDVVPADASVIASAFVQHDAFFTLDVELRGEATRLFSRPGVFSWQHLDEATELLASVMDVPTGARVLDLGCGCGALGVVAARLSGTGRVQLVDVDAEAVRCATGAMITAKLTNATAVSSDVAGAVLEERFDVVVTNPPFHVGKGTDLDVPTQFILDAWDVLDPHGQLLLVANRTLPYERIVQERFGNIRTLHDGQRFKVLCAEKRGAAARAPRR